MTLSAHKNAKRASSPSVNALAYLERWCMRIALFSALLLFSIVGFRVLSASAVFDLRTIDVQTDGRLRPEEIARWAGLRAGQSLITLGIGDIRRRIEAHPWVKTAEAKRTLPHRLEIRIRERRPVAKAVLDAGTFLVDEGGVLFARWDPSMKREELVPLTGLRREDFIKRPEVCAKLIRGAVLLIEMWRHHPRWKIKELGLQPTQGLRLKLIDGPSDIRLGFGEFRKRSIRLRRILADVGREIRLRDVRSIDLRFSKRAFVRFSDGTG